MNDHLISRSRFLDALVLDADNKTDLIQVHQALEKAVISPDEVRDVGCEVCNYDKPLPQEGLSHDFYIHDGAIYHYDSELGWEGTDIAFCPFCGKRLRMKGAEDGTTDNT